MQERHYLTPLFEAASVAIIGASERAGSIGAVLVRNMLDAGYQGKLFAVNPKHEQDLRSSFLRLGRRHPAASRSGRDRDQRRRRCPQSWKHAGVPACARRSSSQPASPRWGGRALPLNEPFWRARAATAYASSAPTVSASCVPSIGLNATFAHGGAKRRLDRPHLPVRRPVHRDSGLGEAKRRRLLQRDLRRRLRRTWISASSSTISPPIRRPRASCSTSRASRDARRFMSALRAAARVKPVLADQGRAPSGGRQGGAVAHRARWWVADDVFDAALRRAGVVRTVQRRAVLRRGAGAVRTLPPARQPSGGRHQRRRPGRRWRPTAAPTSAFRWPQLSDAHAQQAQRVLADHLVAQQSAGHRRRRATRCATARRSRPSCDDEGVDGVLAILAPQALTDAGEAAQAGDRRRQATRTSRWSPAGWAKTRSRAPRDLFEALGVPTFRTPEPAVELFSHISNFYRNQKLLMQTPEPLSPPRSRRACRRRRLVIETALLRKAPHALTEMESKALLAAFRIPISQHRGGAQRRRGDGAGRRDRPAGGDEDRLAPYHSQERIRRRAPEPEQSRRRCAPPIRTSSTR
ncbi:MAG: hypothetical protein MZW92_08050 [Comamonadaceae bacterium]|nr:hypothetical protein [Comamonadaceae bacterium]